MDAHREACRRQHRVLGHFLAIQAWLRKLDCIVLTREDLESYLGLKVFKSQRIEWILEDLDPWFPHARSINKAKTSASLASMYLSRLAFDLPKGNMTTQERISKIVENGLQTARLSYGAQGAGITEGQVVQYLALLDSGLAQPAPLPAPKPKLKVVAVKKKAA